jgi:replicative DNA helicase
VNEPNPFDAPTGPLPPCDINAEQAVLGGMLQSALALEAAEGLAPEDFYRPAHQTILEVMLGLVADGEPVDPITVAAKLVEAGEIARIGGAPYLHTLMSSVPTVANVGFYVRIVRAKSVLRRLAEAGDRIGQIARAADDDDVSAIVARAEAAVSSVVDRGGPAGEPVSVSRIVSEVVDGLDDVAAAGGVGSGYLDLDKVLHPFQPGQLIVVGARPGVGKSTVALDLARHAAVKRGVGTVLFSLEMSEREIGHRLISAEGSIPLSSIITHGLTDPQMQSALRVLEKVDAAPLFVDDTASVGMPHVRSAVRKIARKHPVGLVIVDYLQLMTVARAENRQVAVANLARALKVFAKEQNVPVVALSQLNRGPEHRTDKRPEMSDLRESGAIEQDADVVLLLHRDDKGRPGEIEVSVAKQRNGASGVVVSLSFLGHFCRLADSVRSWEREAS